MNKLDIENALKAGLLYVRMGNGNIWKLRRNGNTQLWKTRPMHYSIPVKAGLKATGRLDHNSTVVYTGTNYVVESL